MPKHRGAFGQGVGTAELLQIPAQRGVKARQPPAGTEEPSLLGQGLHPSTAQGQQPHSSLPFLPGSSRKSFRLRCFFTKEQEKIPPCAHGNVPDE